MTTVACVLSSRSACPVVEILAVLPVKITVEPALFGTVKAKDCGLVFVAFVTV